MFVPIHNMRDEMRDMGMNLKTFVQRLIVLYPICGIVLYPISTEK